MQRFGLSPEEQQQGWDLWRTGKSLRAVARAMGQPAHQVRRYVASTGGRRRAPRRRATRCLSAGEREEISRGLARGDSCRQIAAGIGRSHTTVSRELRSNGGRERYRAIDADEGASERARRPKTAKLATNGALRAIVEERLELKWSPEQIAGWLGRTYPDDEQMAISHETLCPCSCSRAERCAASCAPTCAALARCAALEVGRRRRAGASSPAS